MKKKITMIFLMFALILTCAMLHGVKAEAAGNTYTQVDKEFNKSTKVGKYYFKAVYKNSGGYIGTYVKKSAKGKTYYKLNDKCDSIFTNGRYVYYMDNGTKICRLDLKTKKVKSIKKLTGSDTFIIFHVYGSSIYFYNCLIDDTYTIYNYNVSKKKLKTLKKGCACIAEGSGKYIVIQNSKGQTILRNCITGKTAVIKVASKAWNNLAFYKNVIAFVKYDKTTKKNVIMKYNIVSKKTKKVASYDTYYSDDDQGEFSSDLSTYTYDTYDENDNKVASFRVNMKTGKITEK